MQITPTQAKILAALLDGDSSRTDLRQSSLVYGSTFTHALGKLMIYGLVEDERVEGVKTRIVSINFEGKRCLKLFNRGVIEEGPKAPPRTARVKVDYLPGIVYCRNNGHTHLLSRGAGC